MIITGLTDKDEWIRAKFSSGLYEITQEGVIISHNPYKGAKRGPLKTKAHPKTGYLQIVLWDKDLQKNFCCLVHRIVALIHLPNPHGYSDINHIDGDKTNNSIFNLEWCSASQNNKHAFDVGLRTAVGEANGQSKLTEAEVREIRSMRETGALYRHIAEKFGIHPMTVGEICRNEIWRHI